MTFLPADDEDASENMVELDFARIAILLEAANAEGDAYDVLRDALERLNDHKRVLRGPLH